MSGDHEKSRRTGDLDNRGHIDKMRFDPNNLSTRDCKRRLTECNPDGTHHISNSWYESRVISTQGLSIELSLSTHLSKMTDAGTSESSLKSSLISVECINKGFGHTCLKYSRVTERGVGSPCGHEAPMTGPVSYHKTSSRRIPIH